MQNRDEIFHTLKTLLSEMFEIDAEAISLTASLSRDLDIDSIDAVDLMVKLREVTGRRIQPEDFKNVRTVQDVVDTLRKLYPS
jgi:acyl carrier protein